jgi:hypothetical protein
MREPLFSARIAKREAPPPRWQRPGLAPVCPCGRRWGCGSQWSCMVEVWMMMPGTGAKVQSPTTGARIDAMQPAALIAR